MNYRIDHLAFRTLNREKCVKFFTEALGYQKQADFTIYFNDEKTEVADCTALEPADRLKDAAIPWIASLAFGESIQPYVLSPEIFVSEGSPGSIVHTWATQRGGAGLHHIALQVADDSTVEAEMQKWLDLGWCEGFSTAKPIECDTLSQVFTKPSTLTGTIFELIKRKEHGFCQDSVKELMNSTRGD